MNGLWEQVEKDVRREVAKFWKKGMRAIFPYDREWVCRRVTERVSLKLLRGKKKYSKMGNKGKKEIIREALKEVFKEDFYQAIQYATSQEIVLFSDMERMTERHYGGNGAEFERLLPHTEDPDNLDDIHFFGNFYASLTLREKGVFILRMLLGLGIDRTGRILGISRTLVSQVERRIWKKYMEMRKVWEDGNLEVKLSIPEAEKIFGILFRIYANSGTFGREGNGEIRKHKVLSGNPP